MLIRLFIFGVDKELKEILNKIEYLEYGGILINSVGLIEYNLEVELIK